MDRIARLPLLILLGCLFISSAFGTTYYVAANGSDSNNGTKTTPWAHLPGMATWTGKYAPVPGDTFILRGCDVWGISNFPVSWSWSGTAANHIVIDVDQAWYNTTNCPSGWNRPKFDAQSAVINPPECTNYNSFFLFWTVQYVDVNWIELIHYYWASNLSDDSCSWNERIVRLADSDYITMNNWYVHNWSTSSTENMEYFIWVVSGSNIKCQNCKIDRMVLDNSDGMHNVGGGLAIPTTRSICKYVLDCFKMYTPGEYAYNDISYVGLGSQVAGTGPHPNCIETLPMNVATGTYYIHDNRVHDNLECEGLQVGNPGETDYVWNNLWYNNTSGGANGPNLPQGGNNSVAMYYWNNTNVDSRTNCINVGSNGNKWSGAFVMQNNHCITNGNPTGTAQSGGMVDQQISGASTITFSNNVVESASTATGQGFTNSETYVYSPPSTSGPTIGTGINLTQAWPKGFSTADTTYACNEQTVNGVVQSVCPARSTVARSSTGVWDVGAYDPSSASSAPAAPTGLTAAVQ